MESSSSLESFLQQVFSIHSSYINMFGKNMPGMGGTAIATQGITTSAGDVINKLREAVANFAELKQKSVSKEQLTPLVKEIEGHLLMLETLDSISDKTCDSLIDKLNSIANQ